MALSGPADPSPTSVNYDKLSLITFDPNLYHSILDGCHASPTIGCALDKMIEVESQITATLLELSSYASNGDMGLPSDDNYPEKDILVNQSNCQAPHIEDFIVAHYLTEQREVCF